MRIVCLSSFNDHSEISKFKPLSLLSYVRLAHERSFFELRSSLVDFVHQTLKEDKYKERGNSTIGY